MMGGPFLMIIDIPSSQMITGWAAIMSMPSSLGIPATWHYSAAALLCNEVKTRRNGASPGRKTSPKSRLLTKFEVRLAQKWPRRQKRIKMRAKVFQSRLVMGTATEVSTSQCSCITVSSAS